MVRVRLKKLLRSLNMTQRQAALMTGVSKYKINALCTNNFKYIDLEVIEAICLFFQCDINELIEITPD